MSKIQEQISEFNGIGELLGFVIQDGHKIKYLKIIISEREYWIKPAKEIREQIVQTIPPGCWVEVRGESKRCLKTGKVKLKAHTVKLTNNPNDLKSSVFVAQSFPSNKPLESILVCQKSDCWQRGGKAVCQMLETKLRDRGLENRVQIKRTGCLKQCKKGPNLVMLPDKARYSHVQPQQVSTLIEKHFSASNSNPIASELEPNLLSLGLSRD
jgi:(2Fe-2S) ferredoxin